MIPEDLDLQALLARSPRSPPGYPAISIFHEFGTTWQVITGTADWVYEHLGAYFWSSRSGPRTREAGITDYKWVDWYRDHPVEDEIKLSSGATSSVAARRTSTGGRFTTRSSARSRSAAGTA